MDQDLIRAILLKAEAEEDIPPKGWHADVIFEHAHYLWREGLIAAVVARTPGRRQLNQLGIRPAGLEFLEAIRDDDLWRRVKLGLDEDLSTATPLQIIRLARRLSGTR